MGIPTVIIFNSSELFYFFLDNETPRVVNNVCIYSSLEGTGWCPSLVCPYCREYCCWFTCPALGFILVSFQPQNAKSGRLAQPPHFYYSSEASKKCVGVTMQGRKSFQTINNHCSWSRTMSVKRRNKSDDKSKQCNLPAWELWSPLVSRAPGLGQSIMCRSESKYW